MMDPIAFLTDGKNLLTVLHDVHTIVVQGTNVLVLFRSGRAPYLLRFDFASAATEFVERLTVTILPPKRPYTRRKARV